MMTLQQTVNGNICERHTITHVGSNLTIHIAALNLLQAEPKVNELDDHLALLAGA
jgi:hypothetical protein